MNKFGPAIITGVIMCILGFLLAYQIYEGSNKPGKDENSLPGNSFKIDTSSLSLFTYEELITGVEKKEKEKITEFLEIKGGIVTRKEGPVLKREIVNYLEGIIYNNAHVLHIKEISVKVEFYSQTNALIDDETLVLFVNAEPLNETEYKSKINVPQVYNSIIIKILDAKPGQKEFIGYNAIE